MRHAVPGLVKMGRVSPAKPYENGYFPNPARCASEAMYDQKIPKNLAGLYFSSALHLKLRRTPMLTGTSNPN